jgi:glucose/arabinose dehydrogenase
VYIRADCASKATDASESAAFRRRSLAKGKAAVPDWTENILSQGKGSLYLLVDDSASVRASESNSELQRSIRRIQRIRSIAFANTKYQQASPSSVIRFGTRGPAKRRWTGGWFSTH